MRLLIFLKNGDMLAYNKHVQGHAAGQYLAMYLRLEGVNKMVNGRTDPQGAIHPADIQQVHLARVTHG